MRSGDESIGREFMLELSEQPTETELRAIDLSIKLIIEGSVWSICGSKRSFLAAGLSGDRYGYSASQSSRHAQTQW